jgi:hypothetical protein
MAAVRTLPRIFRLTLIAVAIWAIAPMLPAAEVKFANGTARAFASVEAQGEMLVCVEANGSRRPYMWKQLHDSEIQKYFPEKWKELTQQRKAEEDARKPKEEPPPQPVADPAPQKEDPTRFDEQERMRNFAPVAPNQLPAKPLPANNQPPPLPPFIRHQSFIQLDAQFASLKSPLEELFKNNPPGRTRLRQAIVRGGGVEVVIELPIIPKDDAEAQLGADAVCHALINLFRESGFDLKRERVPLSVWALSVIYPDAPGKPLQVRPCGRTMLDAKGNMEFRTINEIVGLVPPRQ